MLDNFSTGRSANLAEVADSIEIVEGDLRDRAVVARAVAGAEAVFHLAALGSVQRSVDDPLTTNEVNVTGTLNLLIAARDAGARRFVFSSSSSVYGDTPVLPKREDMTPNPLSPYALSKLTGEHYVRIFRRLYGLPAFALRYFNVFGPRQDPGSRYAAVIPLFVAAARAGKPCVINGDGGQTRDFTYVDNVVDANLCCLEAPEDAAGGVYNIALGGRVSILELARSICELAGAAPSFEHRPARAGDVRDSQADNGLARSRLGWTPAVDTVEGLRRTVAWYMGASS